MAEIPPHLLARSKARKAALDGAPADSAAVLATSDTAPVAAPVAAPAKAVTAPPPPPVEPPATKPMSEDLPEGRRRMPVWMLPVIAAMPVFAFFYAHGYQTPPRKVPTDPLVLGAEVYRSAGCGGCHGSGGEGLSGPKLAGGQANLTFPDEKDHVAWVKSGSQPFGGQFYGAPDRVGGQHKAAGAMPAFAGTLSEEEIDAVVLYERTKL